MARAIQSGAALFAAAFALAVLLSPQANAAPPDAPVRRIYPSPLVSQASRTYGDGVRAMWSEVLTRVPAAHASAAQKVQLLLPSYGPTPLSFWAEGEAIFVPAETLRFIDDLLSAISRRAAARCDAAAVFDYVAMSAGGKTAKSPMAALGLTARTDPDPGPLFATLIRFQLAHELGHVVLGHAGAAPVSKGDADRRERDADAFALDTLAQLALVPTGLAPYLRSVAWFEAASVGEGALRPVADGFPLAPERLRALAKGLRDRAGDFGNLAAVDPTARELEALAALIGDTGVRDRELQRSLARSEPALRDCAALAQPTGP